MTDGCPAGGDCEGTGWVWERTWHGAEEHCSPARVCRCNPGYLSTEEYGKRVKAMATHERLMTTRELQLADWIARAERYDKNISGWRTGALWGLANEMFPNEMFPGHRMTPGKWQVVEEEYAVRNPAAPAMAAVENPEPDAAQWNTIRLNLLESRLTALVDQVHGNKKELLTGQHELGSTIRELGRRVNEQVAAHRELRKETTELGKYAARDVLEKRFQEVKKVADARSHIINSEIDQLRTALTQLITEVKDLRRGTGL